MDINSKKKRNITESSSNIPDDIQKDIGVVDLVVLDIVVQCDGVMEIRQRQENIRAVRRIHGDTTNTPSTGKQ